MPNDWTHDRLVSFALSLTTFDALSPAQVQELGEALSFLVQRHGDAQQHQAATIARLQEALQCLQAGVLLLGEEDHP